MYDDEETTLEESENTFEDDGQQSEPEELNDDDIYNRYDRVKRTPNSGNSPIRHRMMSPKPNINNMGIGQSTQEKANTNSPDNSSDNSKSKASSILLLGSESSELKGKGTIVKALKNPVTRKIILIAIPICLLLIVILLISAAVAVDEFNSGEYEYYTEGACQQVKYQDKLMSIEDYVAGAMPHNLVNSHILSLP